MSLATPMSTSSRSPRQRFLGGLTRHKGGMVGAALLALIAMVSIAAPVLTPFDPDAIDLDAFRQPPSSVHLLGTDSVGRDVFTRLLYGGRVSLMVGLSVALASTVIGLMLGAAAGLYRGIADGAVSRATELVIAFPAIIAVVIIGGVIGPGGLTLIAALTVLSWPTAARVVRGLTMSLDEQEFIVAARVIGVSDRRIMQKYITPAVLGPLTVTATFAVATAILAEAALSYLGFGVQPPTASWGNMLVQAQSLTVLEGCPWMWVPPGLAIAMTVLAINALGDGVHDALDPRSSS